jgi:hypothetical protein
MMKSALTSQCCGARPIRNRYHHHHATAAFPRGASTEVAVYGLITRWSLEGTGTEVSDRLRDYVRDESHPRFTGRAGLIEKIWTMSPGGFFAGNYLWATQEARAEFVASLATMPSKVTDIVGHGPDVIEEYEIVAVAEGGEGMTGITARGTAFSPSA